MANPRPHNKRNEIIAAALRLFAQKGIKSTTIRDISTAAGVTEGALYRHFESKEELARSLFEECAAVLHQHLAHSIADVQGAREQLCALCEGFFAFAAERPEVYEFVMARHHDTIGPSRPGQPMPKDIFVRVLENGMAAGELRDMDSHLAAAMVIGMCLRTIFFLDRGLIVVGRAEALSEVCRALESIFAV